MGKFCVEEITMGFTLSEPKSIFYGHFETKQDAIEWARETYKTWEEIEEDDQVFFQIDHGLLVKEAYVQDCEDEGFLRSSCYLREDTKPI